MQFKFGYDSENYMKFTVFKIWDFDGIAISLGDSTYMYYHTAVTGIPVLRSDNLVVYPNPSKGKFTLSEFGSVNAIEIYDIQGHQVYSDKRVKQQTSQEIDLSGYAKGIYFIKIYDGTKKYSRKVVIQ